MIIDTPLKTFELEFLNESLFKNEGSPYLGIKKSAKIEEEINGNLQP